MRVGTVCKLRDTGTEKLVTKYGDRLVAVRYRYSHEKRRRYKTVELIVAEDDWAPPLDRDEIVSNPLPPHKHTHRVCRCEFDTTRKTCNAKSKPSAAPGTQIGNCGMPPRNTHGASGSWTGLCDDLYYTQIIPTKVLHLVLRATNSISHYAV